MPEYAIMRMEKLKSRRALLGAIQHNTRDVCPLNADAAQSPKNLIDGTTQEVMKRYSLRLPKKVRKDAVHAIEVIATASEDWFKTPEEGGKDGDIGDFANATIRWAEGFFGAKNVLSTTIHMDEKTPHIHILAMPLVNGKLNAKALIGGSKYRMRELQDEFYAAVGKPLGMERGVVRDDPKRHTKPREVGRLIKELEAERVALAVDRQALETERAIVQADKKALELDKAELNKAKKAMFTETMQGALGAKFAKYGLDSADGITDYWQAFGEAFSLAKERRREREAERAQARTLKHTAEPKRTR